MYRTSLLAVLLIFCLSIPVFAAGATTIVPGTVNVDKEGFVTVLVRSAEGETEELVPSNGQGLWEAGRIEHGELVDVKITTDRGKHRGHVTVLK